jgi:hypothetical protein
MKIFRKVTVREAIDVSECVCLVHLLRLDRHAQTCENWLRLIKVWMSGAFVQARIDSDMSECGFLVHLFRRVRIGSCVRVCMSGALFET